MFYLNLGYQWRIPELENSGVCVGAHGADVRTALTRSSRRKLPPPERRLFDPQLYLNDLDYVGCESVVERLATYPWFNPAAPRHKKGQRVNEWKHQIQESVQANWPYALSDDPDTIRQIIFGCLRYQKRFGVGGLIIPGPVVRDPETDFSREATWIDYGLEVIPEENGKPIYATLAISDTCLAHKDPDRSQLLEVIIDQIAARPELDGVYLVLKRAAPSTSIYLMDSRIAWALLTICYNLGTRANFRVIVNYVDVFGLACLAAGAKAFCTGPTTKSRRCCHGDFERSFGWAYPRFYSHSLVLDLLPERDIEDKLAQKRLLRYIESDETLPSESLFEALKAHQSVNQVVDWQERPNNTTVSQAHYVERVIRATEELEASGDKISTVLHWLQDAEKDAGYLADRFETDPLTADHRHVSAWRSAFENFLDQYGL